MARAGRRLQRHVRRWPLAHGDTTRRRSRWSARKMDDVAPSRRAAITAFTSGADDADMEESDAVSSVHAAEADSISAGR